MRTLDATLPQFDVHEVHSIVLPCSPERALELALSAPAAPDRVVAALFRLRGLRHGTTIQGLFEGMGFETILAKTTHPETTHPETTGDPPTELVVAAAGTPWRLRGGLQPFADARPGMVRMAADIRAVPAAGGCILSTETRVQGVDAEARRAFRRYWLVVGPFSGVIRRRWLQAVARAAR